jgi:DNA-binding response OmpR family regulator
MTSRKATPAKTLYTKLDEISSRLSALEKGQLSLRENLDRKLAKFVDVATAEVDGPVPPDNFRLDRRLYGPFTRLEWRLLACLWGKSALEISGVLEELYGHDHEQDQDALRSVVKRLNPKLRKQSFPGRVMLRQGYVFLQWVRNGSGATTG